MKESKYIILDNEMKITEEENYRYIWFKINDEKYMFKSLKLQDCYKELFGEEVAKKLKIPTVSYELAKYHNETGVITKNYNPYNYLEYPLFKILNNYCIKKHKNEEKQIEEMAKSYNLEKIWEAFSIYYQERKNKKQIIANLMKNLIDTFFLQLFLGNNDLHYYNISIIDKEDEVFLAPNFDYDNIGNLDILNFWNDFLLQVTYPPDINEDIILTFLAISDSSYTDYFKILVNKLPTYEEIINNIEIKTGDIIPHKIKMNLMKNYKIYLEYYKTILEEQEVRQLKLYSSK